jgi:hypothetical protein
MDNLEKENEEIKKVNNELQERMKYLEKENAEIKKYSRRIGKSGNKVEGVNGDVIGDNNRVYINNIQLSLTKYGTESYPDDRRALTNAVAGVHTAIPNLVKLKHFDPRKPENNNIMIPNKKENKIQVFNGERWETRNKRTTLEDIFLDFPNFMDSDIGYSIYESQSSLIKAKLDKLRDLCEKVHRGDSLTREESKEKKRIEGEVENIIRDHQIKGKKTDKIIVN